MHTHTPQFFHICFQDGKYGVLIEFMAQRELHGEEAESGGKGIKLHNEISIRRWLKKCERAFSKGFYWTAAGKVCAVFMAPGISASPSQRWASSLGPSYGFKATMCSQQWQWQLFSRGAGWGDSEQKPSGIAIGRRSVRGNYCCIANWEIGKRQGKGRGEVSWGEELAE